MSHGWRTATTQSGATRVIGGTGSFAHGTLSGIRVLSKMQSSLTTIKTMTSELRPCHMLLVLLLILLSYSLAAPSF